jgi:hypothetical protein
MTIRLSRLALFAAALLATACGPNYETNADVFERYRPKIVAKREEIARTLDQAPSMKLKPIVGAKKPSFIKHGDMVSFTNLSFIEVDTFKDTASKLPDVYFETYSPLDRVFDWLEYPIGYSPEGKAADYHVAEEVEEALASPYVAFYQQTAYVAPEYKSKDEYRPGGVRFDVILIELAQNAAVAACDVMVMSSDTLTYEYSKGMETLSWESALRRDLAENAMRQIGKCFADQTGGEFTFDS